MDTVGFEGLNYWYGKPVTDIINQNGGVWEFFRTKANTTYLSEIPKEEREYEPELFNPTIANISQIYCLENKIDALLLQPRQSRMSYASLFYVYWLLMKYNTDCRIYYLSRSKGNFVRSMNILQEISDNIPYNVLDSKEADLHHRIREVIDLAYKTVDASLDTIDKDHHIIRDIDTAQLNIMKESKYPIYILIEDALWFDDWEQWIPWIGELKDNGSDITVVGWSTLNQNHNTAFRIAVWNNLYYNTDLVYLNDEIFYREIPKGLEGFNIPIIKTDYRFMYKDKAIDFRNRLTSILGKRNDGMPDPILDSEIFLRYSWVPVSNIRY